MKKYFNQWKNTILLALLILVIGVTLRLFRLTILPVFGDEAIYIRWSQIMIAEPTMRFISLSDGKQPLFMWSVMPFLKIFNDPLFAGRFASVITGLITSIGIFVLTYLFSKNRKVSLLAMLIYSFIPFSVFFERLAMSDSMLSMFGIWSFIFSWLIVRYKRLDLTILFGFIFAGALLTKSPALYFSLLLPLTMILDYFKNKQIKNSIVVLILLGLGYLIAYSAYNFILHLGPNFHMIALRNKDYVFPISHLWQNPKDPFIFHFDRALEWFVHYGTWPIFILFIAGLMKGLKEKTAQTFLIFAWLFVPLIASSMFARSFTTRYVFYTLPYYIIIASQIFINNKRNIYIKIFSWTLLILAIILSLRFYFTYFTDVDKTDLAETDRSGFLVEWTAGKGIKEVSQTIIAKHNQDLNKKIVIGTEGYFGTLPDGLQMYLADYPEITVIGVGIDLTEIPIQLKESKQAGNLTYLVINSSRIKMDLTNPNLKIISSYQKSLRNPQSHEFTLHGPSDVFFLIEII